MKILNKNRRPLTTISAYLGFLFFIAILFCGNSAIAQSVQASIDSSSIKIGEQITYQINVQSDPDAMVVFPVPGGPTNNKRSPSGRLPTVSVP